jgi:broad specificity phosphatase PhoE
LAPQGHAEVQALVQAHFWAGVDAVYTSQEYKTIVVGEAIHAAHQIPCRAVAGLGEAKRDVYVGNEAFFQAQINFFADPQHAPIDGWEAAQAAQQRFVRALDEILERHPVSESVAAISHATVLTLYVAYLRGEAPSYEVWRQLGFMEVMAVDRVRMQPVTGFLGAPYPLPHTLE